MSKNRRMLWVSTAMVAFTGLPAQGAYAQETDEGLNTANEIVVTARRREESLQDVPVAVTAVSAESLERKQIDRSEEHTSELQSLMRISYAVFCLKKKPKQLIPYPVYNYNHTST